MPAGRKTRVLIVVDYADAADILATLIQLWGHNVHTCYDGGSALRCCADYRPDVVLLEIALPRMSGFEVAQRMAHHPDLSLPLVVAVTGYWGHDYRVRATELGFADYFVKPVDLARLSNLLRGVRGAGSCRQALTLCSTFGSD